MSLRRVVLLAVAGVLVGLLTWSLTQLGGAPSAAPTPSAVPTPGAVPTGAPPTSPGAGGTRIDAVPSVPGASTSSSAVRGHVGGVPHGGSEILPSASSAASAAAGLPGLRPPRSTTAALITVPLPQPATTSGELVAGYPAALAPPTSHTVATSSVAGSGHVMQASLTGSCRRPCAVLRLYRTRLAARGFADVATPSVENRPTASLRRGGDSVTVTVTAQRDGTVSYALFAVLSAEPRR